MNRIRKAFEAFFQNRLRHLSKGDQERRVRELMSEADRLVARDGVSLTRALLRVQEQFRGAKRASAPGDLAPVPGRFLCDAGLGGLARWLRAAGHDAVWIPDIEDGELLQRARTMAAKGRPVWLLTTDSMLMERRVLRDGLIPAFWLPPTLTVEEQLKMLFRELNLSALEPRCMRCGGELRAVEKESVLERIPPRTARWLEEFFVCARCDQLFWRGTHWRRINRVLRSCLPSG